MKKKLANLKIQHIHLTNDQMKEVRGGILKCTCSDGSIAYCETIESCCGKDKPICTNVAI